MKALEILKNNFIVTNEENMAMYRQDHIQKVIAELEALENKNCSNCKHHSEGKQPDGFGWENCEHNWQCSNIHENNWEQK